MNRGLSFLVGLALLLSACTQAAPSPTAVPAPAQPAAPTVAAAPAPAAAAPTPTAPSSAPATTAVPAPTVAPKPTGELRIAFGTLQTEVFDPAFSTNNHRVWHRLFYDFAIGADPIGPKLSNDAGLASDWKLSADAMSLTLSLRKGVKFHNGDEMTADDVKYSIERILLPGSTSIYGGAFRTAIKDMQVPDRYTLVINMKSPSPTMPTMLSSLAGLEGEVYSKKYVEQQGKDAFAKNPISTGPYKLAEHVQGTRMVFEAFDDYWRGAPKVKRVTLLNIPEESTRITMLKRGELDIAEVSRENVGDLKKSGFSTFVKDGAAVMKISFEMDKRGVAAGSPITKLPVRRAMSLAINRKELIDTLFYGQGSPAGTQFGSYAQEYEPLAPDPFDPQKAKQSLADAGYPKGFPLDFYSFPYAGYPELQKVNEAVAGYWKAIGIDVQLKPTTLDGWLEKMRAGALQTVGSVNGYPQQNQYLTLQVYQGSLHPNGRQPYIGAGDNYMVPELSKLIDKATATTDDKERLNLQKQMAKYVYDNLLVIPLVEIGSPWAAKSEIKQWNLGKFGNDVNLPDLIRSW